MPISGKLKPTMKHSWDACVLRAENLAAIRRPAKTMLSFYAALLRAQKSAYEYLRSRAGWLPSGNLEQDLEVAGAALPDLLHAVGREGPSELIEEARALLASNREETDAILIQQWRQPSDTRFFAKAFLQPYACWLAEVAARPVDRPLMQAENRCPFCGGAPQVSFLHVSEPGAESGGRGLICATCLQSWSFRRAVCASCLEERPEKIGYFQSHEFEHVRIEVCDSCRTYIKAVDLTRLGLAVPLVDEVAAAALDVWACEQGYTKLEMNLVGL